MAKKKSIAKKPVSKKATKKKSVKNKPAQKASSKASKKKKVVSTPKKKTKTRVRKNEIASTQVANYSVTAPTKSKPPNSEIHWDDTGVATHHTAVFNVSTKQAGMKISLGEIQSRNDAGEPLTVAVSNQVFMNPFAVKRLIKLLNKVVNYHDSKYGTYKSRENS